MQNDSFSQNLISLPSISAPDLSYTETESHHGVIIDENENEMHTFPVIEREERHLSTDDAQSYVFLRLYSYGELFDVVKFNSNLLFKQETYTKRFGSKPFAEFTPSTWDTFYKVIKAMLSEIEQSCIYTYSGWNSNLDCYLFGNIMVDINNTIPIKSTSAKIKTPLSLKSASDVCRNVDHIMCNLSTKPTIGYLFNMYLLLAHSKPRFVALFQLAPEFILSIIASTGYYKTSTSKALYNTYDAPISSFEDTLASIRRSFQSTASGTIIVDDYKHSSSKNDARFEKLVRLSGDIKTSGKYVVGNKVVDEPITGMAVITGEVRPHLQQSSYSRILFVDLEEYPINLDYLTKLQESAADINSFIALFTQYILQTEFFDETFKNLISSHRDQLLQDKTVYGMHGRYYSMYGWLAAMWDVYVEFLKKYDIYPEFDFKSEIKSYIYSQHTMYDNDPIKLFKAAYLELLSSNKLVVSCSHSVEDSNFDIIDVDGILFLKSGSLYDKVCRYWQNKGIDFTISEKKLRSLLYDAGILKKTKKGTMTTERKTIHQKSFSGYTLFKSKLLNYGESLDNEKL